MAAMCLVEIVSSRPSANGAQAVEQDRSDEAPRKCIALPLLKICSNFALPRKRRTQRQTGMDNLIEFPSKRMAS